MPVYINLVLNCANIFYLFILKLLILIGRGWQTIVGLLQTTSFVCTPRKWSCNVLDQMWLFIWMHVHVYLSSAETEEVIVLRCQSAPVFCSVLRKKKHQQLLLDYCMDFYTEGQG